MATKIYFKEVKQLYNPLPPALVERGNILREVLYKNAVLEISFLLLSPDAKIRMHEHTTDNEIYLHISTGEISFCKCGDSHELENTTQEEITVLSIKTTTPIQL